jgi:hypothetical protein
VIRGRIAIVQEDRFRLVRTNGQAVVLTLAHDAGVDMIDLERLERAGTPVEVRFAGQPNTDGAVVHEVRALLDVAGAR